MPYPGNLYSPFLMWVKQMFLEVLTVIFHQSITQSLLNWSQNSKTLTYVESFPESARYVTVYKTPCSTAASFIMAITKKISD